METDLTCKRLTSSSAQARKRVRTACLACRDRKTKCDGMIPCDQCRRAGRTCEFSAHPDVFGNPVLFSVPTLPQGRKSGAAILPGPSGPPIGTYPLQAHSSMALTSFSINSATSSRTLPRELSFVGQSFGQREVACIGTYMKFMHTYAPLVPPAFIRDGMNPLTFEQLGLHPAREQRIKQCATQAAAWAAAAMGAGFHGDYISHDYLQTAIGHLRECFEVPCDESLSAYICVAEVCYMLGQKDLFFRYARFADALLSEMRTPLSEEMQMCMHHLAVHVLTASQGTRQLHSTSVTPELNKVSSTKSHAYVMYSQNHAHVKLFQLVNAPNMDAEEMKIQCLEGVALLTPVFEQLAADQSHQPNVLGRALCDALLSYFKFKSGSTDDALMHLGDLLHCVENNRPLLRLPAMWTCLMAIMLLFEAAGCDALKLRLQTLLHSHAPPAIANDDTTELHAVQEMMRKLSHADKVHTISVGQEVPLHNTVPAFGESKNAPYARYDDTLVALGEGPELDLALFETLSDFDA